MNYREIQYTTDNGVATITLNRPDKLNAWTAVMEVEFTAAIRAAALDDAVRAIVVTGAGRGFCAGADLSLLNSAAQAGAPVAGHQKREVDWPELTEDQRRRYAWMLAVNKPIIAAINGPAVGLGFIIALYCDIRIASATAKFNTIFARRGLIAEYGMAWLLPRIVGLTRALELTLTARMLDAEEALRIGLVNQVLPEADFAAAVQAYAAELAATVSPRSTMVMKRQIYAGLSSTLGQSLELAFTEMKESLQSEDFKEGVAHFLEKRPPRFKGR
ncbi:MAG: enoyl-CoA hydratase [Bryobacteraceae bacterium]